MMMFGCRVHPASVVMGSRWLVVPTPTAQSLVRVRMEQVSACLQVSVTKSAQHLPTLAALQLYIAQMSGVK